MTQEEFNQKTNGNCTEEEYENISRLRNCADSLNDESFCVAYTQLMGKVESYALISGILQCIKGYDQKIGLLTDELQKVRDENDDLNKKLSSAKYNVDYYKRKGADCDDLKAALKSLVAIINR